MSGWTVGHGTGLGEDLVGRGLGVGDVGVEGRGPLQFDQPRGTRGRAGAAEFFVDNII
jgi:hypothetical protein